MGEGFPFTPERHPSVAITGGAPQCRQAGAAHPNRRTVSLWVRVKPSIFQVVETPFKGRRGLSPQSLHQGNCLIGVRTAPLKIGSQIAELVFTPARANTEDKSPLRQHGKGGCL